MIIGGILFIALSVIAAGISGFAACLSFLKEDIFIENRLATPYWYNTFVEAILSVGPKKIVTAFIFAVVMYAGLGIVLLI